MLENIELRAPGSARKFEVLCRKLWSDIWEFSEVKKRISFPFSNRKMLVHKSYQYCDFYFITKKDVSAILKEINKGIDKARRFSPRLQKLFFISMHEADTLIKKYILRRNKECEFQKSFEVYVLSWSDVMDLVNENELIRKWYLNDIAISFDNDDVNLEYNILKVKKIVNFCHRPASQPEGWLIPDLTEYFDLWEERDKLANSMLQNSLWINKSFVNLSIKVTNTGNFDLTDYKLKMEIEGIKELQFSGILEHDNGKATTVPFVIKKMKKLVSWEIMPTGITIASQISIILKNLYLLPDSEQGVVLFSWTLESKLCQQQGMLALNYSTDFITKWVNVIISSGEKQKQEVIYNDYYEKRKPDMEDC